MDVSGIEEFQTQKTYRLRSSVSSSSKMNKMKKPTLSLDQVKNDYHENSLGFLEKKASLENEIFPPTRRSVAYFLSNHWQKLLSKEKSLRSMTFWIW